VEVTAADPDGLGDLVRAPGYHALRGVVSLAPDDAWASGEGGDDISARARHWDGTRWVPTRPPGGFVSGMYGLAAVSPTDIWGVGDIRGEALTNHWDGTSWRQVNTPPPAEGYTDWLQAVSAVATDDVWAVGRSTDTGPLLTVPLIEHWDGSRWRKVPYELPYGNTYGRLGGVVAISTDDVWAVGSTYGQRNAPLLLHWDGASWEPHTEIITS